MMHRRHFVKAGIVGSVTAIAGCSGDSDSEPDGTNSGPGVVLEYSITAGEEPEELPEDVRATREVGGRREEGNKWVVVSFEVVEGTLSMSDVWFRSRVETSDRFYNLDHASDLLSDGVQSRGEIKTGGTGTALYQIPTDESTYSWNLQEMRQDVEANEE